MGVWGWVVFDGGLGVGGRGGLNTAIPQKQARKTR